MNLPINRSLELFKISFPGMEKITFDELAKDAAAIELPVAAGV
jgi:hypothetical protein